MSIESPINTVELEDQRAALELIKSEPLLQNDKYAQEVVRNGGRVDSGRVVDIGNFLAARLATLQEIKAEEKVAAMKTIDPEAYMAATSVRSDLEAK